MSDRGVIPLSVRSTLRIPAFRRLWAALGLASVADWVGLLAITAYANALAGADYSDKNFAIAAVLFVRVVPALLVGPLGGYVADRLDRRTTLVSGLMLRAGLFASIPLVGTLSWLLIATVLVEAVNLVWTPTKDALVPDLVPQAHLDNANRLNLATTYGAAVPAAGLFVVVTVAAEALHSTLGWFEGGPVEPTLHATAVAFALAGLVCRGLRLPVRDAQPAAPGVWGTIAEGWSYARHTPLVRGLTLGIVGAFAAGGAVIALGRVYVSDLGAGDPGYGVLFGAVFLGLGAGMWRGPRVLRSVGRHRLFGISLVAAGVMLAAVALVGDMVLAVLLTLALGYCAGVAWVTGYTLIGLEVEPSVRGRTFAFVHSLVRLTLAVVLAVSPLIAGVIGAHRFRINADAALTYSGAQFTFLIAAALVAAAGVAAYRQMDDRPGESLREQLSRPGGTTPYEGEAWYARTGVFIALEGGEGAGKTTQAQALAAWLRERGREVILTHEPGDTAVGQTLRSVLLDPATELLSDRTEALLYAADKAEHVETVIAPALARGAVVVTDRYVDSTLAYQGGGRALSREEVERLARWATGGLRPHLTVLLDVDPATGITRAGAPDRLESEPAEFHERVRASFLDIAAGDPAHYLVVDATSDPDQIASLVRRRVEPLLHRARSAATTASPQGTP